MNKSCLCPAQLLAGVLTALLLAGCASQSSTTPSLPPPKESLPPIKQQEATPQYRSQLRSELGAGYYERGQMDVALEELNEAVRLDPNNARAWNIYGLVYAVLGENGKAEQSFQRALQLAPQDSDTRHNWGWYLCTHGRARESLAEFEAALRNPLYRTPETALVNAGKCSASLGNVGDAETYFRRALQVAPNNATAAYNLALMAFKTSRLEEARGWMKTVMMETKPPAEALFLGMCIERRLRDFSAEQSYVSQLRNRYPDAAETKAIATGGCE
jgi:type IV pilus assembly protein PilF